VRTIGQIAVTPAPQHSSTPILRAARFEHEDEHEHEHEYDGAGEANRTPKPCIGQLLNQAN
jgi:hypothetical protein